MKTKSIIYLNNQNNENGNLCILYFKNNDTILNRIKQNNWIIWDSNIKHFSVKSTSNTIGLLIDIFDDIAEINTTYYHAHLKGNTEKTVIGDAVYFNGILESKNKIGSVLLVPYKNNEIRLLIVKYKYTKPINELLVRNKYAIWNSELNDFTLQPKLQIIKGFISSLSMDLKIQLHNELKITDCSIIQMLYEQSYSKDILFKSVPLEFLKFLQLKGYSENTINVYFHFVLRFINCFR